jgi:hypothetical protein
MFDSFGLPGEVRNMVYTYYLEDHPYHTLLLGPHLLPWHIPGPLIPVYVDRMSRQRRGIEYGLLLTSRQTHTELRSWYETRPCCYVYEHRDTINTGMFTPTPPRFRLFAGEG